MHGFSILVFLEEFLLIKVSSSEMILDLSGVCVCVFAFSCVDTLPVRSSDTYLRLVHIIHYTNVT